MNLYELNQAGYISLPNMNKADILDAKAKVRNFLAHNFGKYYMLLCNELHYYTVFDLMKPNSSITLVKELFNVILVELGTLKAVEINDTSIEFWIEKDGECHMYAFFNYDRGVVQL